MMRRMRIIRLRQIVTASAGERYETQMTVSIENGALKAGEVSEACVVA